VAVVEFVIFEGFLPDLVRQRNILAHSYGHAIKQFDWTEVWETIEYTYPALESTIESAVEDPLTITCSCGFLTSTQMRPVVRSQFDVGEDVWNTLAICYFRAQRKSGPSRGCQNANCRVPCGCVPLYTPLSALRRTSRIVK
jgi:hypothetical protein